MYHQTKGIVLKTIKYGETSLICTVYTCELGSQTFIANGVRKKKGKMVYYQPMNILDITFFYKKEKTIQRIKEVKMNTIFTEIPSNIYKSSVALFITEVLEKCLKEEEKNILLFDFLTNSIKALEQNPFDSQFHIQFLVALSRYLGIFPDLSKASEYKYFDMLNGHFTNQKEEHPHILTNTNDLCLAFSGQKTNNKKEVINHLLNYYALHIEGFKGVKSKTILETILN